MARSTMGAPHRRTIYIASLEAHVDRLHAQLLDIGLFPIPFDKLEPFKGLNSKTAKVILNVVREYDVLLTDVTPEYGRRPSA